MKMFLLGELALRPGPGSLQMVRKVFSDDLWQSNRGGKMRNRSMNRRRESRVPIQVMDSGAELLPFADNFFDTAVATLVFCTIPDPKRAFQEISRVCKPDAKVLLLEHVRLDHPVVGKIQDWVTPLWKRVCDGCELNRKTAEVLQQEGFKVIRRQTHCRGLFITLEAGNGKMV
jgi:ubiquinone/menaquinone biosynthesis C-methylase UbiE